MLNDVLTLHSTHFFRMSLKCTGVGLGFFFLEMSVLIMVLIANKGSYLEGLASVFCDYVFLVEK